LVIAIGSDHVGLSMKTELIAYLEEKGHTVRDMGTCTPERADYPVYGARVARAVASGECARGIAICGTGVGIGIACNKVRGIRCVTCSEPYSALMSRKHNDANCLSFGARVIGPEMAKMIVDCFLETEFEGGRHQARVDALDALDSIK